MNIASHTDSETEVDELSTPDGRRRAPKWLRIILPALLIVAWVTVAGTGGPYFGKVDEVSSNDQTTYLPESADATQVQQLAGDFTDSDAIPAIAVFVGDSALSQSQLADIETGVEAVGDIETVEGDVSPPIPSDDNLAVQAFIPINADTGQAVSEVGDELRSDAPDDVTVYITGPAGFNADLTAAFAGIDGLLLAVALAAVLVIL